MRSRPGIAVFVAAVLAWPVAAICQVDDSGPRQVQEEGTTRRRPSVFHRAACGSPEEQMSFAGELLSQGRTGTAVRAYMAVVYEWHDSEQAPQAQMACAKLLYETGHYERAFEEFQYLVDFYQGQFPYEEAVEYQFKIANHVRTEERGRFLFFPPRASPERALPLFVQYLKNAPRAAHADEAQFFVGAIHDIKKEYEQAVVAYETLQHRYPKSELLAEAGYLAALDHVRIARSVPRDERTTRATLAALAVFVRDYPDHRGAPEIRAEADTLKEALAGMYYERALFYDRTGGRPKAAIIAYSDFLDNFPSSSRSDAVRKRIAELESTAGGLE